MDVTLLCQEWAVCNMLCRTIHTGGLQQCPPQREGTAVHMDDATRQRKQKPIWIRARGYAARTSM